MDDWGLISALGARSFVEAKIWILAATGLSRDALHIYVGMTIFIAARLILRGPRRSLWALALVCAAASGGELLDHLHERSQAMPCNIAGHIWDLWNSAFWPVILAMLEKHLAPPKQGQSDEV